MSDPTGASSLSLHKSAAASSSFSLKAAQLRAVYRMLAFNDETASVGAATTASSSGPRGSNDHDADRYYDNSDYQLPPPGSSHNAWKVLVYDAPCQRIISPLLNVQQLRRRGVTLHLPLHGDRQVIPDVPAVYFCRPTQENLARIARDCAQNLYGRFHINLVTRLDRPLMEEFARLVVQTGSLQSVASIHDQYLDYVVLERNLFSLSIHNSYRLYNGASTTEAQMDAAMNDVALGLFSVVASLGQVPIIRCPKGGAPEMVARKVHKLVAEHPTLLRSKTAAASGASGGGGRPLLVLLDRNADLITPLQHTSTYQALIDDVLTHSSNRVEFTLPPTSAAANDGTSSRTKDKPTPSKRYDLDPDDDPFYHSHKFQPFPEAIESNGSELQEVSAREQEIRGSSTSSSTAGGKNSRNSQRSGGGGDLASAVDSLPALLDRKKQLEVHTSILQAVMNQVAARDIPQYYELESALATGTYKNDSAKAKRDVLALIAGSPDDGTASSNKGSVEDKLRLAIVWLLATGAKSSDVEDVTNCLQESVQRNPDSTADDNRTMVAGLRAFSYLKQLRTMQMIPSAVDMLQTLQSPSSSEGRRTAGGSSSSSSTADTASALSSFMAKATTQATGLLAKATDKVISSMLGKIHKTHATQVLENLCEYKAEDETYLYLDPKVKGDVDVSQLRGTTFSSSGVSSSTPGSGLHYSSSLSSPSSDRPPVHRAIVFVMGGGCYGEYQNLQLIAGGGSSNVRRQVVYGSTEIVNSASFLRQLGELGS